MARNLINTDISNISELELKTQLQEYWLGLKKA